MKKFFTSDTHFGSERTLKFSRRPFKDTKEMDEAIIKNWNSLVSSEDIVYHLGDFGDFDKVKKLNGKIILVLGNYEQDEMAKNFDNNFEKYKSHLLSLGFIDVIEKGSFINLDTLDEKIYITHKPTDCNRDYFNLFGHIHEKNFTKKFGLNVGIDCYHFKPATIDDVLFYKNAIEKYYDDDVFCEK